MSKSWTIEIGSGPEYGIHSAVVRLSVVRELAVDLLRRFADESAEARADMVRNLRKSEDEFRETVRQRCAFKSFQKEPVSRLSVATACFMACTAFGESSPILSPMAFLQRSRRTTREKVPRVIPV